MNLTPAKARDLITRCLVKAQKETFAQNEQLLGRVPGDNELQTIAEGTVRLAFRETKEDYDNPTRQGLMSSSAGKHGPRFRKTSARAGDLSEFARPAQNIQERVLGECRPMMGHLHPASGYLSSRRRHVAPVLLDQYSLPYQCSVAGRCDTLLDRTTQAFRRVPGEFSDVFDEM